MTTYNQEFDDNPQQRRPITRKSSEKLRTIREKLLVDHNGELFEDSTEMIRQMREDRMQYLEGTPN